MDRTSFPNLEVRRVIQVRVTFSARQWQLYVEDHPTESGLAARTLNDKLTFLVNNGVERGEIYRQMFDLMIQFCAVGANDSEPRAFLTRVLNYIFKEG